MKLRSSDSPRPCPICGKPPIAENRPFCSARCAQIDLGRWLKGNYRIPTEEMPEDGSAEEPSDAGGRD